VVPFVGSQVAGASTIVGWCFKFPATGTPAYPAVGQPYVIWLDNVRVNLSPPPPAPTLTDVFPAQDGLNMWEVGTDTNQQEDIESDTQGGNGFQLATSASPVEYKLTIATNPVPPAGFRTFVEVNTDNLANYNNQPDARAESMAEMDIVSAGDGTATGYFRYRINDTNDYYNGAEIQNKFVNGPDTGTNGTLASATSTLGGTWTLKFTSPSTGVIIAPGGVTSSAFMLNANAVAAFSEGTIPDPADTNSLELSLYIGSSPGGSAAGLGHYVDLIDFTMTGNASAFEDNFATDTGPYQGSDWVAGPLGVASYIGTVLQVPVSANGPDVYVEYTLPAAGYDILGSTTIPNADWTLLSGTNSVDTDGDTSLALGGTQIQVIPLADVENLSTGVPTNHLFFEMIKNNGGLHQ
jgi:hypothetical protein